MDFFVERFQEFKARRSNVGLAAVALVSLAGLAVAIGFLTSGDPEVSAAKPASGTEPQAAEVSDTAAPDTEPDDNAEVGQALAQSGNVQTEDTGSVPETAEDAPASEPSTPAKPVETPPSTAPPTTAAPAPAPSGGPSADAWAKLRDCEASGRYDAVNPAGPYYGAYQFNQATWNSVASSAGRNDLVGVVPSKASPADQDAMALALYNSRGAQPWPSCGRFLR